MICRLHFKTWKSVNSPYPITYSVWKQHIFPLKKNWSSLDLNQRQHQDTLTLTCELVDGFIIAHTTSIFLLIYEIFTLDQNKPSSNLSLIFLQMTKTPLEIIRTAVYEHCTELLFPTVWCFISVRWRKHQVIWITWDEGEIDTFLVYEKLSTDYHGVPVILSKGEMFYDRTVEIIGHPIRIEHLLRTLGADYAIEWAWFLMECKDMKYQYIALTEEDRVTCDELRYDLTQPLENQSPETLQFLADRLWKNK